MSPRYRRYFDTSRGTEICLLAEPRRDGPPPLPASLAIVIDRDDDLNLCQVTLDAEDTRMLHRLLGEALGVMEGVADRAAVDPPAPIPIPRAAE